MSDLSPKAAAIVRAGRNGLQPPEAVRERITAALRSRLGDAAIPLEAGLSGSLFVKSAWVRIFALGAALGVAGGATLLALHEASPVPVRSLQVDVAQPAEIRTEPVSPELAIQGKPPTANVAPEANAPSARRPTDRLAAEVAVLARATSELHAGRAASALQAIDEHQRKFPRGLLAEERRAARVQALCALGRRSEAQPELDRLARIAPQSPNTARAQRLCAR